MLLLKYFNLLRIINISFYICLLIIQNKYVFTANNNNNILVVVVFALLYLFICIIAKN